MKTIKQIQQFVENIAINSHDSQNEELINSIRGNFLPLFQFNMDVSSSEEAHAIFGKVSDNTNRSSFAAYLPDGQHTVDKVGDMVMETPTIMEWQGGKAGQNFVISYTNKTKEKAQSVLNQLVVDMLLSLPGRSINLH